MFPVLRGGLDPTDSEGSNQELDSILWLPGESENLETHF